MNIYYYWRFSGETFFWLDFLGSSSLRKKKTKVHHLPLMTSITFPLLCLLYASQWLIIIFFQMVSGMCKLLLNYISVSWQKYFKYEHSWVSPSYVLKNSTAFFWLKLFMWNFPNWILKPYWFVSYFLKIAYFMQKSFRKSPLLKILVIFCLL